MKTAINKKGKSISKAKGVSLHTKLDRMFDTIRGFDLVELDRFVRLHWPMIYLPNENGKYVLTNRFSNEDIIINYIQAGVCDYVLNQRSYEAIGGIESWDTARMLIKILWPELSCGTNVRMVRTKINKRESKSV